MASCLLQLLLLLLLLLRLLLLCPLPFGACAFQAHRQMRSNCCTPLSDEQRTGLKTVNTAVQCDSPLLLATLLLLPPFPSQPSSSSPPPFPSQPLVAGLCSAPAVRCAGAGQPSADRAISRRGGKGCGPRPCGGTPNPERWRQRDAVVGLCKRFAAAPSRVSAMKGDGGAARRWAAGVWDRKGDGCNPSGSVRCDWKWLLHPGRGGGSHSAANGSQLKTSLN